MNLADVRRHLTRDHFNYRFCTVEFCYWQWIIKPETYKRKVFCTVFFGWVFSSEMAGQCYFATVPPRMVLTYPTSLTDVGDRHIVFCHDVFPFNHIYLSLFSETVAVDNLHCNSCTLKELVCSHLLKYETKCMPTALCTSSEDWILAEVSNILTCVLFYIPSDPFSTFNAPKDF